MKALGETSDGLYAGLPKWMPRRVRDRAGAKGAQRGVGARGVSSRDEVPKVEENQTKKKAINVVRGKPGGFMCLRCLFWVSVAEQAEQATLVVPG